jgi:hypothetical protein
MLDNFTTEKNEDLATELAKFIEMTEEQESQIRKFCNCDCNNLKWTSDLPIEEGWYWNRQLNEKPECVLVRINMNTQLVVCAGPDVYSLPRFAGEWYGPIEPPK